MKLFHDEKMLRIAVFALGITAIGSSMMHLILQIHIPGFEPIISAAFWGFLWRWSKVRGKHPGGIWSFLYLLIISMDIYSGISQIWLAIA